MNPITFVCDICQKTYINGTSYYNHIKLHGIAPLKYCEKCPFETDILIDFNQHLLSNQCRGRPSYIPTQQPLNPSTNASHTRMDVTVLGDFVIEGYSRCKHIQSIAPASKPSKLRRNKSVLSDSEDDDDQDDQEEQAKQKRKQKAFVLPEGWRMETKISSAPSTFGMVIKKYISPNGKKTCTNLQDVRRYLGEIVPYRKHNNSRNRRHRHRKQNNNNNNSSSSSSSSSSSEEEEDDDSNSNNDGASTSASSAGSSSEEDEDKEEPKNPCSKCQRDFVLPKGLLDHKSKGCLPDGWTIIRKVRRNGLNAGQQDLTYVSPDETFKCRSLAQVRKFEKGLIPKKIDQRKRKRKKETSTQKKNQISNRSIDSKRRKNTTASTSSTVPPRSSFDAYVRVKDQDKQILGRWSKEESTLLLQGVQKYGHSWIPVSAHVVTRAPKQCKSHFYTIRQNELKEQEEKEQELKKIARQKKVALDKEQKRKQQQQQLLQQQQQQQQQRRQQNKKMKRPKIVKGKWSEKEEALLLKAIKKYGNVWDPVALFVGSRMPKQCKARFYALRDT